MNVVLVSAAIIVGIQRAISDSQAGASADTCNSLDCCLSDQLGRLGMNGPSLMTLHACAEWIVAGTCVLAVGCTTCGILAPFWLTLRALANAAIRSAAQAKLLFGPRATSPWSAARTDAMTGAARDLLRLHLLSSVYWLALACVLTHFVIGSCAIGLKETSNPTSVTGLHTLFVRGRPQPRAGLTLARFPFAVATRACRICSHLTAADERLHDNVFTFVLNVPGHLHAGAAYLFSRFRRHRAAHYACHFATHPCDASTATVEPCPAVLRTHARALHATHSKRHSGKRGRRLAPGLRNVSLIADSGCSCYD
eukprot:5924669-Pleurochrysis_carterae.AAC.1